MPFKPLYNLCVNCNRIVLSSGKVINPTSRYINETFVIPVIALNRNYTTANRVNSEIVALKDNALNFRDEETSVQKCLDSREVTLEDVSDYAPAVTPTFNFASYVNNSPTLQEFVKLNVNLYKLEKTKSVAEFILKLDFEKHVKQFLIFLHDHGVPEDQLGPFITRNPLIFKENIDNLHIRVNYMLSKKFTTEMLARVIVKDPNWLSFTTKEIDSRLGHFQSNFELKGDEVRYLAVKQPSLITYSMSHIRQNTFSFKEEMGFSVQEMKVILLNKPRLFKSCRNHLVERFNFVHNIMKISHEMIAKQPEVLTCRLFRIKQRHLFLQSLGRDQYNPKEPNYVSLNALVTGSDTEFSRNVAKTSIATFNLFQKTS